MQWAILFLSNLIFTSALHLRCTLCVVSRGIALFNLICYFLFKLKKNEGRGQEETVTITVIVGCVEIVIFSREVHLGA